MSRITLITVLSIFCLSAMGSAQETPPSVQRLLEQMNQMKARLDQSDAREKTLKNRVENLEGQLEQQKQVSAIKIDEIRGRVADGGEQSDLDQALDALSDFQSSAAARSALAVGGYFDIEFRDDHTKHNNTFDQHRLVLKFSGEILKDAISFKSEIEIEGGGADVSFLSGNEVLVEYAELHFHISRVFNVKAGALLVPFGRFNTLHDSPLNDLTDRPLVARRIIPSTWTDSGIGVYGAWEMFGVEFDYDIILGNGLDEDFSSTLGGGFRGNRNSFRGDNNNSKMVIGRLGIRPDIGFLDVSYFGLSFGWGHYDDEDDQSMTMFAFDWNLRSGDFELIGEYAIYNLDRSMREFTLGAPGGAEGFYVQLNFHFFPDSWRGTNRFFTDESTFTLVFRVGNMDTDDSATGIDRGTRGEGYRDDVWRYTIGLNFRPIEKTVIKIEYQIWDETSGIAEAGNDRFVISFATYF